MSRIRHALTSSGALIALVAAPALAQTSAQSDSAARAAARANTLPLITTRTLAFTTNEGTWISLDVSPDGRTLVFDLLGDLYTLPITGGKATRITSGQAFDAQPRWSPDGTRIVFTSDRSGAENVWVVEADGSRPRAVSRGDRERYRSPDWMPDGEYILVTRGNDLWLYHRDGGAGLRVTGQPQGGGAPAPQGGQGGSHIGPTFGPDTRYVWVTLSSGGGGNYQTAELHEYDEFSDAGTERSTPRRMSGYQIAQFDRETGRTYIRTHELEGAFRPVPSPDGRWLVYATRHDARSALKLRDLVSGEERWLVMDVQRDDHESRASRDVYPGSAFTPDSRALVTSFGGRIWRIDIPSGAATEIPFTADVELELGPLAKFDYPIDDSLLTVTQIRGARPSPDGRRLAFTALDRLWVADLPEGRGGPPGTPHTTISNARRLTTMQIVEHGPVWSPDGRHIAFVTWNDSIGGDIYRVPATGGAPQKLTPSSAFYDKLSYSPDGRRLLAVRGSKLFRLRTLEDFGGLGQHAELEIVWLPAAGGEPSRISLVNSSRSPQSRQVPHFGPDSTRIYVYDPSEGLVSMRYDGTDRRGILKATGATPPGANSPATADELLISPDGRHVLALLGQNVYLVTTPPASGQTPTVSLTQPTFVPTRRITRVGGDFVGWQNDSRSAFFSIGRSFFRYDLPLADSLVRDSTAQSERAAEAARAGGARPDSAAREAAARTFAYEPHRFDVNVVVRKDRPTGTVALRGARLITMRGDEVIENGDIVVRDNRIIAAGPSGQVVIPAGARTIDASGKTILPGYVDIHAHTWVAWGLHRGQVSQYLAQLAYGVTTQRDPQTSTEDILSYSDLVETGELIGPRLYSTGPGIFSRDDIRSLEDARDFLRRYSDYYGTKTIKQYLAGDRKVRQWVITAARELGLTPTTEGGADFKMNLTLMQDGYAGLEHSLPIFPLYQDVVRLLSFSGLTYTPTLGVSYGGPQGKYHYLTRYDVDADERLRYFTPHDELDKWKRTYYHRADQYVYPGLARELAKVVAAGGRVGLGSHGEVQGLGTHWELWMTGSGGMSNHDVLRVGTLQSADAIGLAADIGSLEAGKLADLQVLDENPLVNIENTNTIRYVMKNGRLYEAATLNEIWPREQRLPTQWWWRLEPAPITNAAQAASRN